MFNKLSILGTAVLIGLGTLASADSLAAERSELTLVAEQRTAWDRNFNPYLTANKRATTFQFIYEPLVVFNALKGNQAHYRLATAHEFSDDLKTIRFTIRDGVKWSDGEQFSAKDVLYSFEQIKKDPVLDTQALADRIESVSIEGENVVAIKLKNVDTTIANKIVRVPIVPQHIWSQIDSPTTFKNETPVGTGPFTEIDSFTAQLYVQCANPHYYDAENLDIDCLKMPQIATNDQLLAAAIKGELDWTSSFIPDIDRVLISANPSYNYWYPAAGSASFLVNFKSPNPGNREAFNDINFRRAFSMTVDRQAVVDIAGYGYWSTNQYASGLGEQFASWNNPQVDAEFGQYNRYDLEGAKQLLSDAGYKDTDGDGFLNTPSGAEISFKVIVPNGWSDFVSTAQIGVEGLQELGVDASVSTPEFVTLTENMKSADFDAAFTNYFGGATPYRYFQTGFHSSMADKDRFGAHHYADPELDSLIDSFTKTADSAEQVKIMQDIQYRIGANQTTIPTMSTVYLYQFNDKRFSGWFSEANPQAVPVVWPDQPERLLHVLALKPR
ncbi:ABC transporter substrate-binding protein [Alginatibacterium sediminis]|uniref:ABC transporter substrate-binding protein n=1 Tax=Alginatibacterium sediminis TaxID=2164068 RepID=A0A420E6L5_9ALTE|nr:ABC transporter substrate-binding protein [Alginatibacterium sediminis]RKF14257.1 ABC transporter substrate-binding protein [Alginatibacterium sediminis]